MGNKKKQTNEFDNYFDDDFEVVYEDPEDLGSYLSEDSSDNNNDYDDMTVMMATPTIIMMTIMMIMMMMTTMIMMTIIIITATAEIQKRKSATTNRIRIPKNPRRKSVADCPM